MLEKHITCRPENFKTVVEREERLQQVLLIPEARMFHHPLSGIFHWHENIMHMHYHALVQAGQNFQEFILHIAPCFQNMTRIYEQDIVLLERCKLIETYILHALLEQRGQSGETLL